MTFLEKYLKDLEEVSKQQKILKNNFLAKNIIDQGLYQEAEKLQKPTIEAINSIKPSIDANNILPKKSLDNKNPIEYNVNNPEELEQSSKEIINIIKNAEKPTKYSTSTLKPIQKSESGIQGYILGTSSKDGELFGLKDNTLLNINGKDKYTIPSIGVAKLLFEYNPTDENITKEDVDEYKNFLQHYKFTASHSNKKLIIQKYYPKIPKKSYKIEDVSEQSTDIPSTSGTGLLDKNKKTNNVLIVPSDPNDIVNELLLQLQATEAGNNNTFNYVNALLKELLNKKIVTIKDYRYILKVYFHV